MTAVDLQGSVVGRIEGTFPYDGSAPEFALVRMGGRFGDHRLVPLFASLRYDSTLQFPYTRADMDEAPHVESARFAEDQGVAARTYWGTLRPEWLMRDFETVAASRAD
jgi:hypothetical protein